jgi:hypothetical protein
VTEQHLDVLAVTVLLEDQVQGGQALRVLEVHVGAVPQESLGGHEAAPLDRAQERRLVLGDRVQARPAPDQQVDGLQVLGEGGRPQAVLRG